MLKIFKDVELEKRVAMLADGIEELRQAYDEISRINALLIRRIDGLERIEATDTAEDPVADGACTRKERAEARTNARWNAIAMGRGFRSEPDMFARLMAEKGSYADIARLLGCSGTTVVNRLKALGMYNGA